MSVFVKLQLNFLEKHNNSATSCVLLLLFTPRLSKKIDIYMQEVVLCTAHLSHIRHGVVLLCGNKSLAAKHPYNPCKCQRIYRRLVFHSLSRECVQFAKATARHFSFRGRLISNTVSMLSLKFPRQSKCPHLEPLLNIISYQSYVQMQR